MFKHLRELLRSAPRKQSGVLYESLLSTHLDGNNIPSAQTEARTRAACTHTHTHTHVARTHTHARHAHGTHTRTKKHKHKLAVLLLVQGETCRLFKSVRRKLTEIRDFNSDTLFSLVDDFKIHERHLEKKQKQKRENGCIRFCFGFFLKSSKPIKG